MTYATTPEDFVLSDARAVRSRWSPVALSGTAVLAITLAASISLLTARAPVPTTALDEPTRPVPVVPPRYSGLLDPGLAQTSGPVPLDWNLPLGPNFEAPAATVVATLVPAGNTETAAPTPESPLIDPVAVAVAETAASLPDLVAPLPLPRPSDLAMTPGQVVPRPMGRPTERAARTPGPPTASADGRTLIDKLFGLPQALKSVLSYAAPEDGQANGGRVSVATSPWSASGGTAVYNIAAHTVTLPNGVTLEAHSGLGDRLDDPRHVNEPNRGATPPATYDLELRAQLFHGVQAIRLNPVSGAVFGRTGLLAHTFMLGPNGDSNGCVSFRNYDAFLQAYRSGQVKRLTVVAGR